MRDDWFVTDPARVVAIDFGAASTKAAWADDTGAVRPLRFGGEGGFPSVVHVIAGVTGRGWRPVEVHQSNGSVGEVRDLKHLVGRIGDAEPVDRKVDVGLNGPVRLVDLVAAVLAHALKAMPGGAAAATSAVLSHPVLWGTPERRFLTEALRAAGGPRDPEFVTEPEAIACFAAAQPSAALDVGAVAVFDLGAATLDVAILSFEDGEITTLTSDGHPSGGDDLDLAVLRYAENRLADDAAAAFRRALLRQTYSFEAEARRAKEMLSDETDVIFVAPLIYDTGTDGTAEVYITRDDFIGQIDPNLATWFQIFSDCLATLPPDIKVTAIIASGGSVRIPAIRDRLKTIADDRGADLVIAGTRDYQTGQCVAPGALHLLATRKARKRQLEEDANRERRRIRDHNATLMDKYITGFDKTNKWKKVLLARLPADDELIEVMGVDVGRFYLVKAPKVLALSKRRMTIEPSFGKGYWLVRDVEHATSGYGLTRYGGWTDITCGGDFLRLRHLTASEVDSIKEWAKGHLGS